MSERTQYEFLGAEPGSTWQESVVRGTGIRASTLASAITVEEMTPEQVAQDFGVPLEAVLESIEYTRTNADLIEAERQRIEAELIRGGYLDANASCNSISTTIAIETI